MSRGEGFGELVVSVGGAFVRRPAVDPVFGAVGGAEVAVSFDAPSAVEVHVYRRGIADGDLMCSLGAREAAVALDLRLAARMVAEGLARLRKALAAYLG